MVTLGSTLRQRGWDTSISGDLENSCLDFAGIQENKTPDLQHRSCGGEEPEVQLPENLCASSLKPGAVQLFFLLNWPHPTLPLLAEGTIQVG